MIATAYKPKLHDTHLPTEISVACQECRRVIGHYVERDGRVFIKLHGTSITVWAADGVCSCGREWHWRSTDAILERLLQHKRKVAIDKKD